MRKHWKQIGRILPFLRPHKRLAAGSVLVTIISAIVALAEPWPLAFLIDGVLGQGEGKAKRSIPVSITNALGTSPYRLIAVGVGAGLGLAVLVNGLTMLSEFINTKLSQRMILRFRGELFSNALRQSIAFHDARSMGDFIARINYESSSVGAITVALPPLAQSFLTLGGMAYISFRIDHTLALLALLVTPFIYYSVGYYGTRIEPRLRHVRGLEGRSINIVIEAMSMLRVIAVFNRERYEHERFVDQATEAVNARVGVTIRQTLFSLVVNMITAIGTALVIAVGALHVIHGQLTIGEMLVVLSYVHSVYTPLQAISHSLASLQEQFIFLAMSLELLDERPEIDDEPGAVELPSVRGVVKFEDVSFSYGGRDGTLHDISFQVQAGQAVAIVGPTGAGKTTLMSLLSRLSQPQQGRVLVDGADVRTVTLRSLREQISVVIQEPVLFSGTVADNIRYGRLDASMDEVVQAAIAANAHDFIQRLPRQYDTLLGENGTALSGGERQRICVARAFLKDAPILILDEPTSSIDSKTEAVILDALEKLMEGRTTFMIAHRLSTLRSVDRILVMDQGRLVEQGTHTELLQRRGLYRMLHDVQANHRSRYHDDVEDEPVHKIDHIAEADHIRARIQQATGLLDLLGLRRRSSVHVPGGSVITLSPNQIQEEPAMPVPFTLPNASLSATPNPIVVYDGQRSEVTELVWTAVGCSATELHIDAPDGAAFAAAEHDLAAPAEARRATGPWVSDGMTFYLQDTSDGRPLTAEHTLAKVVIRVLDASAPAAEGDAEADRPAYSTAVEEDDAGHPSTPAAEPVAGGTPILRSTEAVVVRRNQGEVVRIEYGRQVEAVQQALERIRHRGRRLLSQLRGSRHPRPIRPGDRGLSSRHNAQRTSRSSRISGRR